MPVRFAAGTAVVDAAVGVGRLGAAPGWAFCAGAGMGEYDGAVAVAVAVADVSERSVVAVVEASFAVAGSGFEVVA